MPQPLPDPATLPPSVRPAPGPGAPVTVSGGAAGIEAYADELVAVAQRLGGCGVDLAGAAAGLHLVALDLGEVESSLFDPVGFARVESAVTAALDGPHGMVALAGTCGILDAALRAAATAYTAADTLNADLSTVLRAVLDSPALSAQVAALTADVTSGHYQQVWADLQRLITADPGLAAVVMTLMKPLLMQAAAACPVPKATLRSEGDDSAAPATTPPRDVSDLISELEHRDSGTPGQIDVRILSYPDGSRRAVVDITGLQDPASLHNVTSLEYANRALFGDDTAYENGVLAAMQAAGVRPTDDVMLVGHSEGGMVAVNTARDAVASGRFHVTHVITAGSPVAMTARSVPSSVQVLSMENAGDPVPQLDGGPNPARPNLTTVTIQHGDGTIGGDHGVKTSYLPGAHDVDTSTNASVLSYLAGASDYLDASSVVTHAYQVGLAT